MGCDIHLYVEVKNENGKWESADKWVPDEWDEESEKRLTVKYGSRFYSDRNYNLFAILANVRNGRGFAGIVTGDGFNPIATPKGLPDDCCDLVKQESDRWDGDGHSHSWFTVSELLKYDWTQKTQHTGVVSTAEYLEWIRFRQPLGKGPKSYSADVEGSSIKIISQEEMDTLMAPFKDSSINKVKNAVIESDKLRSVCCRVTWTEEYFQSAQYFWSNTMPRLLALGNPDNVRIVFWFDN